MSVQLLVQRVPLWKCCINNLQKLLSNLCPDCVAEWWSKISQISISFSFLFSVLIIIIFIIIVVVMYILLILKNVVMVCQV